MRSEYGAILTRSLLIYFSVLPLVGWSQNSSAQSECRDVKCVDEKVEASFNCPHDQMLVESLSFSEAEVNLYLASQDSPLSQSRIRNVMVELLGDGRVRLKGAIALEMDGIENTERLGFLRLLDGRSVDMHLVVTIETTDGLGVIEIEVAEIGGFSLPAAFVEQLVTPEGFEGRKSFIRDGQLELPCGIREMSVNDGSVVFAR